MGQKSISVYLVERKKMAFINGHSIQLVWTELSVQGQFGSSAFSALDPLGLIKKWIHVTISMDPVSLDTGTNPNIKV